MNKNLESLSAFQSKSMNKIAMSKILGGLMAQKTPTGGGEISVPPPLAQAVAENIPAIHELMMEG